MIELSLSTGEPLLLRPAPANKFKGTRIPGAELMQASQINLYISFHEYGGKLFHFSLRQFHSHDSRTIHIRESSYSLRLETVLRGAVRIIDGDGDMQQLESGQYRISDARVSRMEIMGNDCACLVVSFSTELLSQFPVAGLLTPGSVRMMGTAMREVVYRLLDNPYQGAVREALYDYSVRELLFHHAAAPPVTAPGELSPAEMTAIYAADQLICSDLSRHFSIHQLARHANTNVQVLKAGFAKVFGMGPFERLLQRKMERARQLLETTDKQVQEISDLAGYETVTGFINAFREKFGLSPRAWRKQRQQMGEQKM